MLRNSQNCNYLSGRKIAELLDNSELQRNYNYLSGQLLENSASLEYSENGLPHNKRTDKITCQSLMEDLKMFYSSVGVFTAWNKVLFPVFSLTALPSSINCFNKADVR